MVLKHTDPTAHAEVTAIRKLTFHSLNSSRSDYQSISLKPDFFDAYTISGGAQIECSVLLKAICSVLRTPIASIDHLRVHLPSPNASKIQWRLDCDNDIAREVGEIHAAGVVCINIKPSNVLLDVSACAVISDYGLPLILKKSRNLPVGSLYLNLIPPEFIHVWTLPCSVTLLQRHGSQ
ncbi:hypothetical protein POM88_040780 [Heracleum sosnowskyi]|uniref:Protein kinase domain-containing protein n=1 Tax=Heracleum sosnowskyi TaxID=360622 RepID=A0AAD8HF39_9APIA|nr:hypothetical protein POM88_040780 [Heracleum sosnowskyi]